MKEPIFFGCVGQVGHYFWTRSGRLRHDSGDDIPWGTKVDGDLTPKSTQQQSYAAIHYLDGWTALSMHDYTVDSRRNSNAAFLFPQIVDFEEALALAREHFPNMFDRLSPITLAPGG